MTTTGTAALRAEGISKSYATGAGPVHALTDVSLAVHPGELLVVRGRSGSGKTTLLSILGGLDEPDAGTVWCGTDRLTGLAEAQLVELRRTRLGYVFQDFGLIPVLTAAENVEIPLRIRGVDAATRDRTGRGGARPRRTHRAFRAATLRVVRRPAAARRTRPRPRRQGRHPVGGRADRATRQRHRRGDDGAAQLTRSHPAGRCGR